MASAFISHVRSGAQALTTDVSGLRRIGEVPLTLSDADALVPAQTVPLKFALLGFGDVSALREGAVRRRHPAPGTGDMSSALAVHIDLAAEDLPWRYTPAPLVGTALRPWLVLLAGSAKDIVPLRRGRVRVSGGVLAAAQLQHSARWAHVHVDAGGGRLSRILSPCPLPPGVFCRAALVPAYRVGPDGASVLDAWSDPAPGMLEMPLYDSWTFTTSEEPDDFPRLAGKLRRLTAAALGPAFATTAVHIRQHPEALRSSGALMRPPSPADTEPAEPDPPAALAGIVEGWTLAQALGRWVLAPPRYDTPWIAPDAPVPAWAAALRRDPRRRGAAGLGAWCAIDQQGRLVEGARRQAGALDAAAQSLRQLSLGLAAGRFLFEHRLPPASHPAGRLSVLGPLLRRMAAQGGGTADAALRGRTPWLDPALLSGALRRLIRPGTALAAGAQPGLGVAAILEAANTCPPDEPPSRFTRLVMVSRAPDPHVVPAVIERWRPALGRFAERAAGTARDIATHGRRLAEPRPPRPCHPADLNRLADGLAAAVDPSRPDAPAIRRVLGRYDGLGQPFPAPVIEPELDLPLATVLVRLSPQWVLPGRGLLEQHRIVALATNPRFVESALVGANQRTLAELRWRNVRVASGWSPLRRFWPRPDGGDITPVRAWSGALGDASHRPPGAPESLLVFVIRSPILRRYPGAAIYLVREGPDVERMADNDTLPGEHERVRPVFKGALEPDLHYVAFEVAPETAPDYALVLEEPDAEPRFRLKPPGTDEIGDAQWIAARNAAPDGAHYARATFHRRTIAVLTDT